VCTLPRRRPGLEIWFCRPVEPLQALQRINFQSGNPATLPSEPYTNPVRNSTSQRDTSATSIGPNARPTPLGATRSHNHIAHHPLFIITTVRLKLPAFRFAQSRRGRRTTRDWLVPQHYPRHRPTIDATAAPALSICACDRPTLLDDHATISVVRTRAARPRRPVAPARQHPAPVLLRMR
jgi:hypothetical protein